MNEVVPSKDDIYGNLARQFVEETYTEPSITTRMSIRDFADWLNKHFVPETPAECAYRKDNGEHHFTEREPVVACTFCGAVKTSTEGPL